MKSELVDMQNVLERLQNLETQNQRLRRALGIIVILVCSFAALGMAAKKGRSVQANEFLLKDTDGTVRAALRMGSTGPRLLFYDENGKAVRALMGVLGSGPALGLYDKSGKTRISLAVASNGANLTFNDADEKLRAELGMSGESPNLMFFNADGTPAYKSR
jgi:hypothetical protein